MLPLMIGGALLGGLGGFLSSKSKSKAHAAAMAALQAGKAEGMGHLDAGYKDASGSIDAGQETYRPGFDLFKDGTGINGFDKQGQTFNAFVDGNRDMISGQTQFGLDALKTNMNASGKGFNSGAMDEAAARLVQTNQFDAFKTMLPYWQGQAAGFQGGFDKKADLAMGNATSKANIATGAAAAMGNLQMAKPNMFADIMGGAMGGAKFGAGLKI